jgi:ubiquinone/menaquinone biosynthesis C-methylase UbiE
MSIESGEIFQSWSLYSRIVHCNWMRHREMNAAIDRSISRLAQPIRVLDLGCGDGAMACAGLHRYDVAQYVGVDLSEDALRLLAERTGPGTRHSQTVSRDLEDCTVYTHSGDNPGETLHKRLLAGDMKVVLNSLPAAVFDAVIASYSLHHFSTQSKRDILDQVVRVLMPSGVFIWIDIARCDDEDRDGFLARLHEEVRRNWVGMPLDEQTDAIEHIRSCDFPETASWMESEWLARGGSSVECLFRDPFYGCWAMRRTNSERQALN